MENFFQKIGGTKFFVCLLVTAISTVLVWCSKISGAEFCAVVGGVAGLFFGSNAAATFANAKLETAKRPGPENG